MTTASMSLLHYLAKFAEVSVICKNVFENTPRPSNYDHLLKIYKVIADIKNRKLDIDSTGIERLTVQDRNVFKLITTNDPYINYDMFKL